MYLANTEGSADQLRRNQIVQKNVGAATQLMSGEAITRTYPFYNVDDIILGSINRVDEGYWDGATVFNWWLRQSRERDVTYIQNEIVEFNRNPAVDLINSVGLASGEVIGCGQVVNASGPRAAKTAAMAGIDIPVEPRKRFPWIFLAAKPLDKELPLTIDPSGVHVREIGGGTYQCGGHSDFDPAVDFDDFDMDFTSWENHVWPIIANRIPQFDAVKVTHEWAGHYSMNTFDQNAIMGPHSQVKNFIFLNGFSGHGLQQSPGMGLGTAEWLTYGEYRTLDLSPFNFDRIELGKPIIEKAIM